MGVNRDYSRIGVRVDRKCGNCTVAFHRGMIPGRRSTAGSGLVSWDRGTDELVLN